MACGRLLFGGDWPVSKLTAPLGEWIDFMCSCLGDVDPAHVPGILSGNAAEVYKLEE